MQMEEAGGGGREQGVQSPGESHRPKHPPQERVTASMGLPEGGSPAVTPHSCWEASPRRQFPTATRQGGRGKSRPGSPAEIQFPCGDGFPWNDSPQGPTLAEARQLRNRNREHQRRADKEGTSICDPQPRVGGTGSDFRPETTETKQRREKKRKSGPDRSGSLISPGSQEGGSAMRRCAWAEAGCSRKRPSCPTTHTLPGGEGQNAGQGGRASSSRVG